MTAAHRRPGRWARACRAGTWWTRCAATAPTTAASSGSVTAPRTAPPPPTAWSPSAATPGASTATAEGSAAAGARARGELLEARLEAIRGRFEAPALLRVGQQVGHLVGIGLQVVQLVVVVGVCVPLDVEPLLAPHRSVVGDHPGKVGVVDQIGPD